MWIISTSIWSRPGELRSMRRIINYENVDGYKPEESYTASDNQLLFEHSPPPPPPPPPPSSPTRFTLVQVTAWKLYAHWTNAVNWSKNARRLCLEIKVRIGTLVGFRVCSFVLFLTFCLGSDDTGAVGRTMSDHDILEMESDMEDLGDIELGMIEEEVGERTWSFATVVCMLFRSADSVWVLSSWCCGSLSRQLSIFLGHVISGNSSFATL